MRHKAAFVLALLVALVFTPAALAQNWEGDGGDNTYYGTPYNDLAQARAGDDQVFGSGGDDALFGENGNDGVHGGNGSDVIVGGDGQDSVFAEGGQNNEVRGSIGNDDVWAQNGYFNDTIDGGGGNDDWCHGDWRVSDGKHDSMTGCERKYWRFL